MKPLCFIGGLIALLSIGSFKSETTLTEKSKINWLTLEELEIKQKKEPRKVIFFIYTNWCGWCSKMDREVYTETEIAKFVNANFYAVKFNAENKKTLQFNNKEYKYLSAGRRRGMHQLASSLANNKGRVSFPSTVFLNNKFEPIGLIPGFQNETKMKQILASINTMSQ